MEARWCSVELNESEAPMRQATAGRGGRQRRGPISVPAVACKGDRFTRSSAFLPGEISWPPGGVSPPVVVEDERTKRRWDERSRMVA
jgi:hypothetical protein